MDSSLLEVDALYLKYTNHFNYQKEGFFLLVSVNAAASPKIASQLASYQAPPHFSVEEPGFVYFKYKASTSNSEESTLHCLLRWHP